jgi:plasmid stabilization system protein ParE
MKKEYQIYWSPEAEETYLKILSDILEKWTIREAEHFEQKVESLLTKLGQHKHLCPPSLNHKQFRKCVITPQTSIIYRITDDIIEIVAFINNKSSHAY